MGKCTASTSSGIITGLARQLLAGAVLELGPESSSGQGQFQNPNQNRKSRNREPLDERMLSRRVGNIPYDFVYFLLHVLVL